MECCHLQVSACVRGRWRRGHMCAVLHRCGRPVPGWWRRSRRVADSLGCCRPMAGPLRCGRSLAAPLGRSCSAAGPWWWGWGGVVVGGVAARRLVLGVTRWLVCGGVNSCPVGGGTDARRLVCGGAVVCRIVHECAFVRLLDSRGAVALWSAGAGVVAHWLI